MLVAPQRRRSLQHRLGVGLSLCAYLFATFGLPLPVRPAKDTSQPFPCMGRPCGCRTAEQCWQSCCCFSPEQRWAWAEAHHVQPPSYAERPAAKECCSSSSHECEDPAPAHDCCKPEAPAPVPLGWAHGASVLRCRGQSTAWVASGAVLPLPRPLTWAFCATIEDAPATSDERPTPLPQPPPAPPPRPI